MRAHVQRDGTGAGAPDQDAYTVNGVTYVREVTENGTTYRKREAAEQPRVPLTQGSIYFFQFSEATPIDNNSRADYQYVVTRPESLTREGIIYYGEQKVTLTDLNVTANTTRSGVIAEYEAHRAGDRQHHTPLRSRQRRLHERRQAHVGRQREVRNRRRDARTGTEPHSR